MSKESLEYKEQRRLEYIRVLKYIQNKLDNESPDCIFLIYKKIDKFMLKYKIFKYFK